MIIFIVEFMSFPVFYILCRSLKKIRKIFLEICLMKKSSGYLC
ncbi:hypothetical protein C2W63_01756 [Bacillus velezensis]|nr:hypothetical protein C2W63_01756 [Bacillus velezensis]